MMKINVDISTTRTTSHEGAVITLVSDAAPLSELYIDFSTLLKSVRQPSETTLDFLLTAATIYSLDKLISRSDSRDGWQRTFEVTIPVKDASKWAATSSIANECLSFLSGDIWRLTFEERTLPIVRRKPVRRMSRKFRWPPKGTVACLFSGGLDSLIGGIDCLENLNGKTVSFVGHHDPHIPGVQKDQKQLLDVLQKAYPRRCEATLVAVGHSGASAEITMRSRSIVFVALGLVVAANLGEGTPLLIPENGTIALNVPLTPARRGSCSTRTAHPYYLSLLQQWITSIGLSHPIQNPLIGRTKGEAVSQCRNQSVLKSAALLSTSCAKSGHTSSWVRRSANACGRCMPCIYRRAALHAIRLDTEIYGNDICTGEVDITNPASDSADDFRACLSFLRHNPSQASVAKQLSANGPLPPLEALAHADTVLRAMNEIRDLLRDKGNTTITSIAGISRRGSNAN